MKPETKRLKDLLKGLGISRTENTVSTGRSGLVIGILLTDEARRTVVKRAEEFIAQGYAVLLQTYRCGCPTSVWLCESSSPELRRTVRPWRHGCPIGSEDLPVTPIDWLKTGDARG